MMVATMMHDDDCDGDDNKDGDDIGDVDDDVL